MSAQPYHFARPARTPRNMAVLIGLAFVLGLARIVFDAAWGLLAVAALVALPALWDMVMNRVATLSLDSQTLSWKTAGQSGTVPLVEITKAVLDTRLDLSVRLTLHLTDGARLRLPSDCVPPKDDLAEALLAQNVKIERNAFALL